MAKKILSPEELVETHKPKNVKFKYIFTDDSLLNELLVAKYPMDTLDTIGDDKLTEAAMFANYSDYERTIIGKSNSPVFLDNGVVVSKKLEYDDAYGTTWQLTVKGLKGGHSGGQIHLERGNANVLAARILKEAEDRGLDVTLVTLKGGMKENAIPREAVFTFVSESPKEALQAAVAQSAKDIAQELAFSDPDVVVQLEECAPCTKAITKKISEAILNDIYLMPNGFQHRSMAIEGLTVASLNLGVISVKDDTVRFEIMIRSADDSARNDLARRLLTLAKLLDLDAEIVSGYSGWAYTEESEMRRIYRRVCERHDLVYTERATHGGLECGIIKGLDPDMDIITFGPISEAIHSPDEKLELQSFDDAYAILCEILKECR